MSVLIAGSATSVNVHSLMQLLAAVDPMQSVDFSWLIGGPQGSGVETASLIFSNVCAHAGYHIFGKREFHSNIKGEHSYFGVRVADHTVRSNTNNVELLISYDAETIFRHYDSVSSDGVIIYDSDMDKVEVSDVHTIDPYFRNRLLQSIRGHDVPPTVSGMLDIAKRRGATLYPVSFREMLANLAEQHNNPRLQRMKRMYNVLGVSLSLGLLRAPLDLVTRTIREIFSKKPVIGDLNADAAVYAYQKAADEFGPYGHTLDVIPTRPGMALVQGFQGTAIGKIVAGCRFQSYYPITPASDESVYIESHNMLEQDNGKPASVVVVQTEDEISAIGMMIGSALTGTRSSTSTSGPGFSLMAEALGWAGINEVPVVITLYQRSGPSTGLPTRHGQDDLLFAIYAGHGEFPRIVYASGDIEESFYDTCLCFNYSDIFQIPVIHMMDKFLASTTTTCPIFDPTHVTIDRGQLLDKIDSEQEYKRFQMGGDGISPRSYLGLENGIFWNSGDESDEIGHITEDPVLRRKMMDKRLQRLDLVLDRVPKDEQAIQHAKGDYTIISWGSTKGPILDAIEMLRDKSISVGFVQIKMLHPFPAQYVAKLLKDAKVIINVESNQTAQMGKIFSQNNIRPIDYHILKYTGRAMTNTEIYDTLQDIISGIDTNTVVLTYGA